MLHVGYERLPLSRSMLFVGYKLTLHVPSLHYTDTQTELVARTLLFLGIVSMPIALIRMDQPHLSGSWTTPHQYCIVPRLPIVLLLHPVIVWEGNRHNGLC
jgi:hypothetical protein